MTNTHDALYRLTGETRTGTNPFSRTYGYDLAGNVTTIDSSTFATYDNANKLSSVTGATLGSQTGGNFYEITGSSTIPQGRFVWDQRGKLSYQEGLSVSRLSYKTDISGRRLYRRTGGTTSYPRVYYIFSGDTLIGEVTQTSATVANPTAAYTWGADGLVSERILSGTPKSLWYHFGPQGETRQLTNASGTVVDTYRYSAYGITLGTTGTDNNPYRYGGKYGYYTDGNTSVMLAGARWYHPHLMRWLTRDPISYAGGDNVYAYVKGNPVRFVDPSGLMDLLLHSPVDRNNAGMSRIDSPDDPDEFSIGGHGLLGDYIADDRSGTRVHLTAPKLVDTVILPNDTLRKKFERAKWITVYGCGLGKSGGFGSNLAKKTGKPVFAPDEDLWIWPDGTVGIFSALPQTGNGPRQPDYSRPGRWNRAGN